MRIRIISEIEDEEALKKIAEALEEIYGEPVEIELRRCIVDDRFLNPERSQYDAWKIVQYYQSERRDDEYVLLITDKDLYAAGLNFVFGLAWRGVAIISSHRLHPEFYGSPSDRELYLSRMVKEAVHELGHLHGLAHCSDRRCVMAFSNSILDTDYKLHKPCAKCLKKLRSLTRF